jgi:Rps23 Pro-64 3,4-dihydroxylase Tpa1-like proline 4-hydroxylase
MKEIIKLILLQNPGLVTVLLTSVVLPIAILWLTNRNNRKLKELEKSIDTKFKTKDEIREQEKKVYSSLSKILFDVQQLHVSLSGSCVNTSCIIDALKKFDDSVGKCHSDIADNMLYLSSDSINLIYDFYNSIGQLKIQLQELDKQKEYSLANVTVYFSAQYLADTLIKIQELFISQRSDLKVEFDKLRQEKMRYCCGQEPPKELKEKYEKLRTAMIEQNLL